jgi:dTDP-4-dehydrorhamnose reductase
VVSATTSVAPDVVVNCAAWTDVDRAESAERAALAVNAVGAGNVAFAAAGAGAWTILISSDYVFDGAKPEPYLESDRPAPLSAYGRSKLAGEGAVAAAAPTSHTIVRTSWLFGARGRCFPQTILRKAAAREEMTVVDDQVGGPTFTDHLARALLTLADQPLRGVVHVAGSGHCSWFDFARATLDLAGLDAEIRPGRTVAAGRAARPAYSVLRSERPDAPTLPDWRQGLAEYLSLGMVLS